MWAPGWVDIKQYRRLSLDEPLAQGQGNQCRSYTYSARSAPRLAKPMLSSRCSPSSVL